MDKGVGMTRLDRARLTQLEEELGDLDFCQYLGLCDEVEDKNMEDYCILNYSECQKYNHLKKIDEMKARRKGDLVDKSYLLILKGGKEEKNDNNKAKE